MASQTRTYSQKKLLGQTYTPLHIVEKILTETNFYQNISTPSTILDPACGDGRFLVPIVQYILENTPTNELETRLSKIEGWDVDPIALKACRKNLEELTTNLPFKVEWKLRKKDALRQIHSPKRFDLIVGNPPYIRIQHLPDKQRQFIKNTYSFCTNGSTDAYLAFFQLASILLKKNGLCGFITPNSYLISETGKPLRDFFKKEKNIKTIANYGSFRVFENIGTYAAVTVFGRKMNQSFKYETVDSDLKTVRREISFSEIEDHPNWNLSTQKRDSERGKRLGDVCQISIGLTTLSDRFYLLKIIEKEEHTVLVESREGVRFWLEEKILKPIVKGSKIKSSNDPIQEYILFPYQPDSNGKQRILSECDLQNHYPLTYRYLSSIKEELLKRDNGKINPVAWYAFGRAQGLDTTFGKKIIFSPINKAPNFILYDVPDCTVYSGYFIKFDGDYDLLLKQLNSQRMAVFVAIAGRDFQGGYKGYNKKVIENFIITDLI